MEQGPKQLFDDFRIKERLSLVTLEEIAEAWCRYQTRDHIPGVEDEDPDWWAVGLLMFPELRSDEPRLRSILDLLIEHAPSDDVLAVVAAGPLEDFLTADEDRLRWVEQRAEESPRFRQALQRVWVWDLPSDAFARIEQAAGGPLARPKKDVVIEVVPGELPGTVHVEHDGVVVAEFETEPEGVQTMIDLIRRSVEPQEPSSD